MIIQTSLLQSLQLNENNIALEEAGKKVTYANLLSRANKITAFLQRLPVEQQSFIGIRAGKVEDIISCMIGIMNARCVFVPVDGSLPQQRLADMMHALQPSCLLTADTGENAALTSVPQYRIADILQQEDAVVSYPEFREDDSLYVYFTSGSTGKPKGIVGKNSSLLQFLQWEAAAFQITAAARFSQFISPYFDAFLRDVFVPLSTGGTICVPPREEDFLTPEKIIPWIHQQDISHIHCVPSLFRVFNSSTLTGGSFPSLKYVMLSGEKIEPSELKNWFGIFQNRIQLVNMYGPTETTMIRCYYLIQPGDVSKVRIPVGKPIAGTKILICDKNLKPCNTLVPGDVYIVTDYASKGYLNDPELTAQKFIRINAGTADEAIAYKTGDIARKLVDGTIDLLGREDRQVKINGIRVELDEIESALIKSGMVQQAVVVQDKHANDALTAYVVLQTGINQDKLSRHALRQNLENKLPAYMIPANIVAIETLPLLSNGKINYKALQEVPVERSVVEAGNDTEERLIQIWKTIIGNKEISIEDNFHKIGGNSLSMMRLISKIYTEFNVRITLADIFRNLTVKKQAALVSRLKADKKGIYRIPKAENASQYPSSSSQATIYFNYELNKKSIAYNMPMAWEIKGSVDTDRMESVFQQLIDRHESLRTSFFYDNGDLFQVVNESTTFSLEEIQVSEDAGDAALMNFRRPFNLASAPLIRAGIVHAGNRKFMIVDMHHIICDGLSQHILHKEFIRLYDGQPLPPMERQYRDYAKWEQQFRADAEFIRLREFWLKNFEGELPVVKLPGKRTSNGMLHNAGSSVEFSITVKELQPWLDALKNNNVTTFSGLFGVLQLLLFQLTGQEDIVTGITSAGRTQEELENVVGVFVKILPIRTRINGEDSLMDFTKAVYQQLSAAIEKQLYNLIDLVADLSKSRAVSKELFFDVLFNFQETATLEQEGNNSSFFAFYQFAESTSNYPLEVKVFAGQDRLNFRFVYNTGSFARENIELFAARYKSLLLKCTRHFQEKLSQLVHAQVQLPQLADDITFNF